MISAVVNTQSNIVVNVIVADPSTDPAPSGTVLINIEQTPQVTIGWVYDPSTGQFTSQ